MCVLVKKELVGSGLGIAGTHPSARQVLLKGQEKMHQDNKLRPWLLPLMFLLGFMVAWGTISIDRQMLIDEQRELRDELRRTKIQMKLREMVDDFGTDWQEMVIWNEKAIEPKEEGK